MPEATTANPGTINRQDWRDDITLLEPQETPYTSMVEKSEEASAMLVETFGDRREPARTTGSREGGPSGQGGNALKNIGRFGAYQQFSQRKWSVTHHQQLVSTRGGLAGVPNSVDRSRARKELELKIDMEAVNCSNNETQDGAGGSADMLTRGAFRWLDPSGTLTPTVDPNFRATAASVLVHGQSTGMLFTEQQFYDLLKELKSVHGGKRSYDVIAGNNVVSTFDNMSRIVSSSVIANPNTAQFYTVRQGADELTIRLMVNLYETSFGIAKVIPTDFNIIDANGVGDPNAALVLFIELWYCDMLENMNEAGAFETETTEGATWQATWVNLCRSPRGNGKITRT